MGKAPSFQFYPGDWRRDTQVQMASMETRGVWFELLCNMWFAPEKGKISGPIGKIIKLLGCEKEEFIRALNEIYELKIGDISATNGDGQNVTFPLHVTHRNIFVTIQNRRMVRENKKRENTRLRVKKHRETKGSNANVTPPSPSTTSTSPSPRTKHTSKYTQEFEKFFRAYPKKTGKKEAFKAFKKSKDKPPINKLIEIIERHKKSEQWKRDSGQYIPNPATWLNQGRWEDELPEDDQERKFQEWINSDSERPL